MVKIREWILPLSWTRIALVSMLNHYEASARNLMEGGGGMSFAEFSYPVLQAWDWWYMYETKGVQMQIGGSDQFGNITAGIDAIKSIKKNHPNSDFRMEKEDGEMAPVGFTTPLLTTASGEKFGKSAGNAVWLDREMTSCFELYQVRLHNLEPCIAIV